VATFATGTGRPLSGRGASPGFRFTLYASLSIVCMFLDQRGGWLERARFALQAAAYPLQLAVNSPSAAWEWVSETFESREHLQAENDELKRAKRELELRTLRFAALARENAQLRGLREALPPVADRWLPAEVLSVELNSLKQRLLINRGASNGVFKGQCVLTDDGLLGQTNRVGPWSAEIILVTDPEHAVPVQIERNGLRTLAVGYSAGDDPALVLSDLPANADVAEGDLLLTSGLGGVFPAGYPVARVTEVKRGPAQPFAEVHAVPLARLDEDREVMLVWFHQGHPAAPATATTSGDVATGSSSIQPQPKPSIAQVVVPPPPPRTVPQQPRPRAPARERTEPAAPPPALIESSAATEEEASAPAPVNEPATVQTEDPPPAVPEQEETEESPPPETPEEEGA
jgi:rod shape-determining protein MreC